MAALLAVGGCRSRPAGQRVVTRAFYHWKGSFRLAPSEREALGRLDVHRLYLRLFDVALDRATGQTRPVGVVSLTSGAPAGVEIVPTVFITNEAIGAAGSVDTLAARILRKIGAMLPRLGAGAISEIQIDCDWTVTTRGRYFALLKALAARAADGAIPGARPAISATIRLHQVRDRLATGVPPVRRGMLMVYNTGSPTDPEQTNAIFDEATIRGYLKGLHDYPLPLDVALPLFSWGAVFHEGAFFLLLNNLRRADLERPGITRLDGSWYRLDRDLYIDGEHLFAGDRVRVEEVDPDRRLAVARLISGTLRDDSISVSLFHLDSSILSGNAASDLETLYRALD